MTPTSVSAGAPGTSGACAATAAGHGGSAAVGRPRLPHVVLVLVALAQLEIGIWGELSPRSFYRSFPGFGHHWVAMLGAFNEHLVRDYAASELGFFVLLACAARWFERRLVLVAGAAFIAGTLPHFVYHLTTTASMSTSDNVTSLGSFIVELVAVATVMSTAARPAAPSPPKETHLMPRLEPRTPHGLDLFRRLTFRMGRRMYGREMAPSQIIAHSKTSLFAYGMVGMAHQKSSTVAQRYKSLAMLRTAQLTGCEWCLDFGSMLAQNSGIPADDLRELSTWPGSARLDSLDKLVLGYAEAMTRTPIAVTNEQFAALREHFNDEQIVELTMAIAAENMFCRTNWALGIEGEGFTEGMYCVRPDGTDLSDAGSARVVTVDSSVSEATPAVA